MVTENLSRHYAKLLKIEGPEHPDVIEAADRLDNLKRRAGNPRGRGLLGRLDELSFDQLESMDSAQRELLLREFERMAGQGSDQDEEN